jgi:hypothetical protein
MKLMVLLINKEWLGDVNSKPTKKIEYDNKNINTNVDCMDGCKTYR